MFFLSRRDRFTRVSLFLTLPPFLRSDFPASLLIFFCFLPYRDNLLVTFFSFFVLTPHIPLFQIFLHPYLRDSHHFHKHMGYPPDQDFPIQFVLLYYQLSF
jgi:hypothetical protein